MNHRHRSREPRVVEFTERTWTSNECRSPYAHPQPHPHSHQHHQQPHIQAHVHAHAYTEPEHNDNDSHNYTQATAICLKSPSSTYANPKCSHLNRRPQFRGECECQCQDETRYNPHEMSGACTAMTTTATAAATATAGQCSCIASPCMPTARSGPGPGVYVQAVAHAKAPQQHRCHGHGQCHQGYIDVCSTESAICESRSICRPECQHVHGHEHGQYRDDRREGAQQIQCCVSVGPVRGRRSGGGGCKCLGQQCDRARDGFALGPPLPALFDGRERECYFR
ncbi:hypothetical protein BJX70DRAFT_167687 [Aspergillus crustosus]